MGVNFSYGSAENALVDGSAENALVDSIEICNAALAVIEEQTALFKLLRSYSVCKESNDAFNSTLNRLHQLERISHQIQFSFDGAAALKDRFPQIASLRKGQGRSYGISERNMALAAPPRR